MPAKEDVNEQKREIGNFFRKVGKCFVVKNPNKEILIFGMVRKGFFKLWGAPAHNKRGYWSCLGRDGSSAPISYLVTYELFETLMYIL